MKKAEMEERIKKLEAQVELLSRMVPQFAQCQPQPYMPAPQWQPSFPVTCDASFTQPYRKLEFKDAPSILAVVDQV